MVVEASEVKIFLLKTIHKQRIESYPRFGTLSPKP